MPYTPKKLVIPSFEINPAECPFAVLRLSLWQVGKVMQGDLCSTRRLAFSASAKSFRAGSKTSQMPKRHCARF